VWIQLTDGIATRYKLAPINRSAVEIADSKKKPIHNSEVMEGFD
jgi:hypothetical protein